MQISQALKDLENSAKAQAEEFESSIIETHKQSAKKIGESLRNSLKSEIDLIGVNLESRLQEITSIQSKNKRWISALMATIALIIGIAAGYQMRSYALEPQIKKARSDTIKELQVILDEQTKKMEAMEVWTIPQAWRHSETEADGKDAVLYIGPSEQGDLRAKRQILHTYENGVEDDDVRRSIARRKRELDTDDQERKERTRIAEEDLDRKIRERGNEFATRQNEFDRSNATFDERLREQDIRIVASAKRKIREIFGVFKKETNKFARRIKRTIKKIRIFEREISRIATNRQNIKSVEEATLDADEELSEGPDNTWEMSM